MTLCIVDWTAWASWIGALATVSLAFLAYFGLNTWRTQFLKQRDHDLALRVIRAVSDAYIIFDELRSPVALFSDRDASPPPPPADGPDLEFEYRKHFYRYKARTMHLAQSRLKRTEPLLEAIAIWEDEEFTTELGRLVNNIANLEKRIVEEAAKFVESLLPDYEPNGTAIDRDLLFSPMDAQTHDPINDEFEAIRNQILDHLKPKLRME